MNNQQFERLVQNLQDIMRCPHCSARYGLQDIHYLGQLDAMTFLHMRCGSCHTPVFASVAMANTGGELLPADLTVDDIAASDLGESSYQENPAELGFEHKALEQDAGLVEIPVEGVSAEAVFRALNPVIYDDVLEAHQYLTDFGGDFETVWKR